MMIQTTVAAMIQASVEAPSNRSPKSAELGLAAGSSGTREDASQLAASPKDAAMPNAITPSSVPRRCAGPKSKGLRLAKGIAGQTACVSGGVVALWLGRNHPKPDVSAQSGKNNPISPPGAFAGYRADAGVGTPRLLWRAECLQMSLVLVQARRSCAVRVSRSRVAGPAIDPASAAPAVRPRTPPPDPRPRRRAHAPRSGQGGRARDAGPDHDRRP